MWLIPSANRYFTKKLKYLRLPEVFQHKNIAEQESQRKELEQKFTTIRDANQPISHLREAKSYFEYSLFKDTENPRKSRKENQVSRRFCKICTCADRLEPAKNDSNNKVDVWILTFFKQGDRTRVGWQLGKRRCRTDVGPKMDN